MAEIARQVGVGTSAIGMAIKKEEGIVIWTFWTTQRPLYEMFKRGLEVIGINESDLEAKAKGALEK
jgi:hypothetical protein